MSLTKQQLQRKQQQLVRRAKELMALRLDIPKGKSGGLSIEHKLHKAGTKLPVVTFREALFSGLPVCDIELTEDTVVRWLASKRDGNWMSDQPCELVQMERELSKYATGKVLIGGLGLGIVANMAAKKKTVKEIVVVEQSKDVIKLVSPYLDPKVTVIQDDIMRFLRRVDGLENFDAALLDTWQGTGEWVWQTEVVPMRRIIGDKIKRVACWQERVMINQVAQALFRMVDTHEDLFRRRSTCHYYAFRCAMRDLGVRKVARINPNTQEQAESIKISMDVMQESMKDEQLRAFIQHFIATPGTTAWENLYGKYWDEAWSVKKD